MDYSSKNHWKGLLQYHIIFVCKYRRKVFGYHSLLDRCKELMLECASKYDYDIVTQEIDPSKPDHYHCLVNLHSPNISPSQIVRSLKQYSTFHLWKEYDTYLSRFYWKEHILWHRGYFCSTIGNASNITIQNYIDSQC